MNEQDQAEMERLLQRQEALQMQLTDLRRDIQHLSSHLNQAAPIVPEIRPEPIAPLKMAEPVVAEPEKPAQKIILNTAVPPPLPPVLPSIAMAKALSSAPPRPSRPAAAENLPTQETQRPEPTAPAASTPPPIRIATTAVLQQTKDALQPRENFEMKLGTYWLVRIGIVMLLTGLVFLGTYAYKNFVVKLEATGKLAMLYTASAALLSFGGWLQRKREKESLRNYGQVLFAGGLAAVYFTTYAAHHLPALRVIVNPVLDAMLLLGWGAFTAWIADRRKSEVLALFAVGLSYYTSAITDIGVFTLASNLVLTATAVFFLIRNRWTTLSFISLLATYGGFAFWRFHHGDWSWDARVNQLWHGNVFLACYWLFFTAAVFFARGKSFAHINRALFASLNNGAFFALVLLSFLHVQHGNFWKFSLGYGAALLMAAFAARKFLADEPVVKNAYLVQGLTLVTIGFIAYFTGLKLALMLAAESVVLTFLGRQQQNLFVRTGGYLTAGLSAGWVLTAMNGSAGDVTIGAAIAAAFLLNAWWENRHDTQRGTTSIRPFSGYFTALAVGVCGIVTWHGVPEQWRAAAWLIEAVVLAAFVYTARIPELPVFSQALALAAQAFWILQCTVQNTPLHWAVTAIFIAGMLALNFLGHAQKNIVVRLSACATAAASAVWVMAKMNATTTNVMLGSAMTTAFLLCGWWDRLRDEQRAASVLRPFSGYFVALAIGVCGVVTWHAVPEQWRAAAWMIEAVILTALFYVVRLPEVPVLSQALALAAQCYWLFEIALRQATPHWLVPAMLVGGTLALSHWWQRQSRLAIVNDIRNVLQLVYALAVVAVLFFWLQPRFAPAAWLVFLCVLAIGLTLYGVATRSWTLAACAQIFLLISSLALWREFGSQKPAWQFALAPIASWLALGVATTAWLSRHDTCERVRRPLLQLSTFYRGVAFVMSLWWIYAYVPAPHYFWTLCAVGLALLALAGAMKNREALVFCALYLVAAFAVWFTEAFRHDVAVNWPNAIALVAVLAAQQFVRRWAARYELPPHAESVAIIAGGLALWIFVSRWVVVTSGAHFLLTVSWAAVAALLFGAGFVLHERMHRWLGLCILAFAIGRVFVSDVWKLETIYRILSFMALGVVLLALGFIYNKYQDKIRQWL
jgi:hypothetical protein